MALDANGAYKLHSHTNPPDWISYTTICSHPEDGLRCQRGVQAPLKLNSIVTEKIGNVRWCLLQEKKIELKENLILELEDKKKNIEGERSNMELTGGEPLIPPHHRGVG